MVTSGRFRVRSPLGKQGGIFNFHTNQKMPEEYIDLLCYIWVLPKIVVPQNGWFIMGLLKWMILGVPLFSETPIWGPILPILTYLLVCPFLLWELGTRVFAHLPQLGCDTLPHTRTTRFLGRLPAKHIDHQYKV